MKTFVSLIFILCLPILVQAQVITGFSGDFTHGSSLTISGVGFDTKNTVRPVAWDNLESGSFSSDWAETGSLSIGNESRHPNSSYCGTNNFAGTGGDGGLGYFKGKSTPLGEKWFAQFWFKLDENFDWGYGSYDTGVDTNLSSVKFFRLWNPGSTRENFIFYRIGAGGSTSLRYQTDNVGEGDLSGTFSGTDEWTKEIWHLLQFEYKEADFGGSNGEFRVWVNGELKSEATGITNEDDDLLKRPLILGFYDSWNDAGTDRDDFYIDDAYMDNTWARVEAGNNVHYNECTHREIQIPTSWNPDSITIDVNVGSFDPSDTIYLFVVNESGEISDGYPMGELHFPGMPTTPIKMGP